MMMGDEDKNRNEGIVVLGDDQKLESQVANWFGSAETLLRVTPMGLCLAALVVMLKNAQNSNYASISYSNISAFTFLVYANGICAGYSVLSAFCTAMTRPPTMSRAWTFFFFDQVLTYMILVAATVALEVIYLAYNGDEEVTWSKECGVFNGFCKQASVSVGITFGSVACYVVLSLQSSFRLFSYYDAPNPFYASKDLEIAAFAG